MTRKLLKLFIICIVCIPASAFALSLGQIQVRSALNQPLDAQIPILAAEEEELAGLRARLATPQVFAQRDVERLPLLSTLEFSVETTTAGRSFIQVSSRQPIREPLLNFLLQADWSNGRLVREYAVLLDLPTVVMRQLAPPAADSAGPVTETASTMPALANDASHKGSVTYGPVAYGETLWDIAQRLRPDASVSRERMMQALLEANPQAFYRPDVDSLSAGETLRVPSAQELDPERFSEAVSRQLAQQQAAAAAAGMAVAAASETEPLPQVRLVPPDAAERADSSLAAEETSAATTSVPALAPSLRIPVESDRPQLQVAGMDELRERLDVMADEDSQAQPADAEASAETAAATALRQNQDAQNPGFAEVEPLLSAPERTLADRTNPALDRGFQEALPQLSLPRQPEERLSEQTPNTGRMSQAPAFEASVPSGLEDEPLAPSSAESARTDIAALQPRMPSLGTAPVIEPVENLDTQSAAAQDSAGGLLQDPIKLTFIGFASLVVLGLPLFVRARRVKNHDDAELAFAAATPEPVTIRESTEVRERAVEQRTKTEHLAKTAPAEVQTESTPLEQADTLLAVGNYKEAKGIVRKALLQAPDDSALAAKLMDIHYAAGDADGFAKDAATLRPQFGAESDLLWEQVARMGRELCPESALFAKRSEFAAVEAQETSQKSNPEPTTGLDFDTGLPFELTKDEADPASQPPVSESLQQQNADPADALEWQLPDMEPPTVATSGLPDEEPAQRPQEDFEDQLKHLDFEFDEIANTGKTLASDPLSLDALQAEALSNATDQEQTEYVDKAQMEKEMGFDFSLDSADRASASAESVDEELASANYVETKLDLAMAYIDMGDSIGARSLLEEVLREGSDNQKERAEQYMAKLG